MAQEVTLTSLAQQISSLAEQMERGFAAIAGDTAEMKGDIGDIRHTMATRSDITDVRDETAEMHAELKDLRTSVDNFSGLPKEIDHALGRIRHVEQHLGIEVEHAGI